MAAALALRGRQLGRRVLVVTVDPAKRLASALGLDLSGVEERLVPQGQAPLSRGTLHAAVIDSKKVFDGFILTHSTDPELMKRLGKNRLYEQLRQHFPDRRNSRHLSGFYKRRKQPSRRPRVKHDQNTISSFSTLRRLNMQSIFYLPGSNTRFVSRQYNKMVHESRCQLRILRTRDCLVVDRSRYSCGT